MPFMVDKALLFCESTKSFINLKKHPRLWLDKSLFVIYKYGEIKHV